MSIERLGEDEVVALQYDEPSVAEELALWCGGEIRGEGLWAPTPKGPLLVSEGDWIVRGADGTFSVVSAVDFAFRYSAG